MSDDNELFAAYNRLAGLPVKAWTCPNCRSRLTPPSDLARVVREHRISCEHYHEFYGRYPLVQQSDIERND